MILPLNPMTMFRQAILLGPLQVQQPAPDADDDDDEDDVSVPSSTPETALPPSLPTASSSSNIAVAAVPSTSGAKSKKKVHTPGDPDIVQLLLQQQERSQAAAVELRQLVTQATGPVNNKSAWVSFLHSNVPHIHDRVWHVYLKMEMENYI